MGPWLVAGSSLDRRVTEDPLDCVPTSDTDIMMKKVPARAPTPQACPRGTNATGSAGWQRNSVPHRSADPVKVAVARQSSCLLRVHHRVPWTCFRLGRRPRLGRLQPRRPADPLGELLPLPRARLQDAQGRPAARCKGRPLRTNDPVIVPGKSGESELIRAHHGADADEVMPPPKSGKTLTTAQIELLKTMDRPGGELEQALGVRAARRRDAAARCTIRAGLRNPIDRFVLARLETRGSRRRPRPTGRR